MYVETRGTRPIVVLTGFMGLKTCTFSNAAAGNLRNGQLVRPPVVRSSTNNQSKETLGFSKLATLAVRLASELLFEGFCFALRLG